MAVNNVQYYPYQITFNSATYDKAAGGPLEVTESENPEVISDMTGNATLPTFVKAVGYRPSVFVKLRDIESVPTRGATSDLVCYTTTATGNRKRTYADMVFIGKDASIVRAQPGETVLRFDHESDDGTTEWYADSAVT
jgi:hypothetical protein